ncbi:chaplin [Streptomyces tuirus]|nr:chaplin [Streptomyces tuirus]
MRQTLSRGMVAAAAATGILSLCGGTALADTSADGVTKGSPGAASGNTVQAPIDVPVNACGNTVDVIAALNPAFGNSCADGADSHAGYGDDDGGYGYGDTPPTKPPHTPPTKPPHTPPTKPPHTPPPGGHQSTPPATPPATPPVDRHTPPPPPGGQEQPPSLPETGAGELLGAAGTSAALIVSGVVLYRRGRAAAHR